jgi:CHASE3 domain sensor protein
VQQLVHRVMRDVSRTTDRHASKLGTVTREGKNRRVADMRQLVEADLVETGDTVAAEEGGQSKAAGRGVSDSDGGTAIYLLSIARVVVIPWRD